MSVVPDLQEIDQRIEREVQERSDRYIADLAALLRFQTVSGEENERPARRDDPDFQNAWRYLRHEAERLGLRFRSYDGSAAVIEWPGTDLEAPALGIATHLDVVPAVGRWTHPPFSGAVIDDAVWGRGAQDDKGPIAFVLAAFDTLQRLGIQPRRTIRLFIGSFEETEDWPDMDRLLEVEDVPEEVLVPDGGYPLCIGEKGIATVEWAGDWTRTLTSDGPLRFVRLEGGARANVVPAEAELVFAARRHEADPAEEILDATALRVEHILPEASVDIARHDPEDPSPDPETSFVVTFTGRAAHAAIPRAGHNAALDALAFLGLVPGMPAAVHAAARFVDRCTRSTDGAGVGLDQDHPFMGPTTLNLGRVALDAAGFHAWCNVRFPIGITPKDIETAFQKAATDAESPSITTRLLGRAQSPFLVDDERHRDFLRPLEAAYETVTGRPADHLAIGGTTYAKLFPLAVGFGPVDLVRHEPVLVHQADERVSVARHLENVRIYALALVLLAGPPLDQVRSVVQQHAT